MNALTSIKDTAQGYLQWLSAVTPWPATNTKSSPHHLLLLAWHFPPSVSSGVYRPLSFCNYGANHGWKISVLASKTTTQDTNASGQALADALPSNVKVSHVEASDLKPSWKLFPHIDGGFSNALATVNHAKKIYRDNPPSIIMATGPAFHNFVAATMLAKYFKVPLVLDYRDEWTQHPLKYTISLGNADTYWEQRCLKAADAVLMTTRTQCAHLLATFPSVAKEKVFYLPNGWESLETTHQVTDSKRDIIRITYTGIIGEVTPIISFLDTLAGALANSPEIAPRIRVRIIGNKYGKIETAINEHQLGPVIECIDQMPMKDAIREMQNSDVLLLPVDATMGRYRAGKLYQYIATGKPILSFGPVGEMSAVIDKLNAGIHAQPGDSESIQKFLQTLCGHSNTFDYVEQAQPWLNKHSRTYLAKALFDMLEALEDDQTPPTPDLPVP